MTGTWRSGDIPEPARIGPIGWLRVALRGPLLMLLLAIGLVCLMILRLIERPLFGLHRPWTPLITLGVCRVALRILGISVVTNGVPMRDSGAMVVNHSTWLDIFVLNAGSPVYFVAKSEVKSWPGVGWLARATGTVFIQRRGLDAGLHRDILQSRLKAGHRLLFFPEGTSTDGTLVLPFKSTLFEAFFTKNASSDLAVQPISVFYDPPENQARTFYGWWGDMVLRSHLIRVMSASRGRVNVTYHAAIKVCDYENRKALAKACEITVRSGVRDI